MNSNAWVVDVLADGEQVYDSGVVLGYDNAEALYNRVVGQVLTEQGGEDSQLGDRTVRLINNGNLKAESTCYSGVVLDSFHL